MGNQRLEDGREGGKGRGGLSRGKVVWLVKMRAEDALDVRSIVSGRSRGLVSGRVGRVGSVARAREWSGRSGRVGDRARGAAEPIVQGGCLGPSMTGMVRSGWTSTPGALTRR